MNWRTFLLNRYTVTFGTIAVVTLAWNLYIAMNDDGIIRGRVVDADGHPVAGATVVLSERTLLVTAPRDRVMTDAEGRFTFTGHRFHRIWLEAAKAGVGTHPQTEYRMYFRGQNIVVEDPIQLEPPAGDRPGKPS